MSPLVLLMFLSLVGGILLPIFILITIFEKFKEQKIALENIDSKLNKMRDNIK